MKIVMYCDEFLYRKLNFRFPKINEKGRTVGSLFSEDEFDNYHIANKKYINISLNPLDGIRDIYALFIQKSWYSDRTCINIAKYFKMLHPESKLIFYMDEGINEHSYFMHRLVTENLGYIAQDMNELEQLFMNSFSVKQENYVLQGLKKKDQKRIEKEFMTS